MAEKLEYVSLQKAGSESGVPPRELTAWARADGVPLAVLRDCVAAPRGELRACLERRGLPVPELLLPWPRVLVADDDPDMRRVADWLLRRGWGDADIRLAADGFQAKELLLSFRPDLFVCDLMMPAVSGVSLCRYVRVHPGLAGTRIIVITGYGERVTRDSLLCVGVDEVISKPFEPGDLRELAVRLLGRAKAAPASAEGA